MTGTELREPRLARGWTQGELAERLGVSQAYVCLLERGRRTVSRSLARKLTGLLRLSPGTLPVGDCRDPLRDEEATAALGSLGYPGFAYVRARRPLNPADLVVRALRARNVNARVVEALPWVLLSYPHLDWTWVRREAKINDLQNRLGFLVSVARELAELRGEAATAQRLAEQEQALERSKLQREDGYRESMTEAERRWLRDHRTPGAVQWNMLSTVNARELASAL